MAEVKALNLDGKTTWSRLHGTANSIYYELSPDDRIAAAHLTTSEIEGQSRRWEHELFSIVVNDYITSGRPDLLEDLLARGGRGGLFCPLTVILNDEGLYGRIPGGVDLLFRAYDKASPNVKPIVKLQFYDFCYILAKAGKSLEDPDSVEWIRDWLKQQGGPLFGHCGMCVSGWSSPIEAPVLLSLSDYLKECRIGRNWSTQERSWFNQDPYSLQLVPQSLHPSKSALPEWFEPMKETAEAGVGIRLSFAEPTYVGPCDGGAGFGGAFVFDITLTATSNSPRESKWTSRVRIVTLSMQPLYLGIP